MGPLPATQPSELALRQLPGRRKRLLAHGIEVDRTLQMAPDLTIAHRLHRRERCIEVSATSKRSNLLEKARLEHSIEARLYA